MNSKFDNQDVPIEWMQQPQVSLTEALQMPSRLQDCHIYKIEVGGEDYIGFTSQKPAKRMSQHLEDAKNGSLLKLHKKLRQFGFIHEFEVLATEKNEILGLVKEISLIKKYNPSLNASPGGEGNEYDVFEDWHKGEQVLCVKNKWAVAKLLMLKEEEERRLAEEQKKKEQIEALEKRLVEEERKKQEMIAAQKLEELKLSDPAAYLKNRQQHAKSLNFKGGKWKREGYVWVADRDGNVIQVKEKEAKRQQEAVDWLAKRDKKKQEKIALRKEMKQPRQNYNIVLLLTCILLLLAISFTD